MGDARERGWAARADRTDKRRSRRGVNWPAVEQDATPYLDALVELRRPRPGPLPHPRAQGRARRGPGAARRRSATRALRARHPGADRGHRHRPRPPTRRSSGRSGWPPRRGERSAAGSWSTAPRGATTPSAWRCAHLGERVVVQRNVHSRVIDGLVLAGLRARVRRARDRPRARRRPLPDARGARRGARPRTRTRSPRSSSRPTYFGAVADVAALAEVAHARGVPLVVDEAWGAHLRFSAGAADSARSSAAPTWSLSSVHKIVGSLTQSAILHLGDAATGSTSGSSTAP